MLALKTMNVGVTSSNGQQSKMNKPFNEMSKDEQDMYLLQIKKDWQIVRGVSARELLVTDRAIELLKRKMKEGK